MLELSGGGPELSNAEPAEELGTHIAIVRDGSELRGRTRRYRTHAEDAGVDGSEMWSETVVTLMVGGSLLAAVAPVLVQ